MLIITTSMYSTILNFFNKIWKRLFLFRAEITIPIPCILSIQRIRRNCHQYIFVDTIIFNNKLHEWWKMHRSQMRLSLKSWNIMHPNPRLKMMWRSRNAWKIQRGKQIFLKLSFAWSHLFKYSKCWNFKIHAYHNTSYKIWNVELQRWVLRVFACCPHLQNQQVIKWERYFQDTLLRCQM